MQNGGIIVQAVSLCSLCPNVLQIYIKGSEIHNTAFVILIKVFNPVCKKNIYVLFYLCLHQIYMATHLIRRISGQHTQT